MIGSRPLIEETYNFDLDADKAKLYDKLKRLKGKQDVCIKKHIRTRSLQANKFYWGVVIKHVQAGLLEAWGEHLTPDETHGYLKEKFMRKPVVDRNSGEIKGYTHATTVVGSDLFSQYLEKVLKHAGEDLGISIPSPFEIQR